MPGNARKKEGVGGILGGNGAKTHSRVGHSQKFIKPCEKECRVFLIHL